MPLRPGAPEKAFARIRACCQEAGFSQGQLCQVLGLGSLADLPKLRQEPRERVAASAEPLAVLARLFLLGMPVPLQQLQGAVGPDGLAALKRLDLWRADNAGGERTCLATVSLYPVAGLLIASDRIFNPDGTPYTPPSDLVYAAISPGTLQFLRIISRAPTRAGLDLCTGSGVAALLLSQTADQATAVDITARSAHFARFNARLNGCRNVDVIQGDLYANLGDRQFDRIVAHPPYAPALADPQTWRDGGETGEAVLQQIVAGLPDRLAPGGTFCAVAVGLDVDGQAFEERVRDWLGQARDEFDLIFAVDRDWTPRQLAVDLAVRGRAGDGALVARWEEHLKSLGMRRACYGALAIRRREAGQAAGDLLTLRTRLSEATDHNAFDQAFACHRRLTGPEAGRKLAAAALRLPPHLLVKVTHGVREGNLAPLEFLLETDRPFRSAIQVEPWAVSVLARSDGSQGAIDLYHQARAEGAVPDGLKPNDFLNLVALLVFKGFLEADIQG